jgi:hypothetical protein
VQTELTFHLFSNAVYSERADGEIIPSTTPVQANRNSEKRFQHFAGPPGRSLEEDVFSVGGREVSTLPKFVSLLVRRRAQVALTLAIASRDPNPHPAFIFRIKSAARAGMNPA